MFYVTGRVVKITGTSQDITGWVVAEKAIKESEAKYKMLFDKSPLPKWIFSLENHRILEVNQAAIDLYGYSRKEFLNLSIVDLRAEDEIYKVIELLDEVNKKEWLHFKGLKHKKKNGDIIAIDKSGHVIGYSGVPAMIVVAKDITDEIRIQQELVKSNERFHYAAKATFDAIWDWDIATDDLFVGDGFYTLFGHTMGPVVKSFVIAENIHPDDREKVMSELNNLVNSTKEQYWRGEYRYRNALRTVMPM